MGKSSNPGGAAGSGSSRRLGRGLSSLIDMPTVPVEVPTVEVATQGSVPEQAAATTGGIQMIEVGAISRSPFQPRREFSDRGIEELASSIRRSGMMQPVIVRPRAVGEFELVAGERRWRAAARAGLERVPALVRELSDEEAAEWAIVENVQREDLNAMERRGRSGHSVSGSACRTERCDAGRSGSVERGEPGAFDGVGAGDRGPDHGGSAERGSRQGVASGAGGPGADRAGQTGRGGAVERAPAGERVRGIVGSGVARGGGGGGERGGPGACGDGRGSGAAVGRAARK